MNAIIINRVVINIKPFYLKKIYPLKYRQPKITDLFVNTNN